MVKKYISTLIGLGAYVASSFISPSIAYAQESHSFTGSKLAKIIRETEQSNTLIKDLTKPGAYDLNDAKIKLTIESEAAFGSRKAINTADLNQWGLTSYGWLKEMSEDDGTYQSIKIPDGPGKTKNPKQVMTFNNANSECKLEGDYLSITPTINGAQKQGYNIRTKLSEDAKTYLLSQLKIEQPTQPTATVAAAPVSSDRPTATTPTLVQPTIPTFVPNAPRTTTTSPTQDKNLDTYLARLKAGLEKTSTSETAKNWAKDHTYNGNAIKLEKIEFDTKDHLTTILNQLVKKQKLSQKSKDEISKAGKNLSLDILVARTANNKLVENYLGLEFRRTDEKDIVSAKKRIKEGKTYDTKESIDKILHTLTSGKGAKGDQAKKILEDAGYILTGWGPSLLRAIPNANDLFSDVTDVQQGIQEGIAKAKKRYEDIYKDHIKIIERFAKNDKDQEEVIPQYATTTIKTITQDSFEEDKLVPAFGSLLDTLSLKNPKFKQKTVGQIQGNIDTPTEIASIIKEISNLENYVKPQPVLPKPWSTELLFTDSKNPSMKNYTSLGRNLHRILVRGAHRDTRNDFTRKVGKKRVHVISTLNENLSQKGYILLDELTGRNGRKHVDEKVFEILKDGLQVPDINLLTTAFKKAGYEFDENGVHTLQRDMHNAFNSYGLKSSARFLNERLNPVEIGKGLKRSWESAIKSRNPLEILKATIDTYTVAAGPGKFKLGGKVARISNTGRLAKTLANAVRNGEIRAGTVSASLLDGIRIAKWKKIKDTPKVEGQEYGSGQPFSSSGRTGNW